MGSDYPHVEGLAEPGASVKDLGNFEYMPVQCEKVMRANGIALSLRRPPDDCRLSAAGPRHARR